MFKRTKAFNRRCPSHQTGILPANQPGLSVSPPPSRSLCAAALDLFLPCVPVQRRAMPTAVILTHSPGHIPVPPALQNPLQPRSGRVASAAPFGSLAALRAYLVPFAQDLPRPRLYAAEQRVPDQAQHCVAAGLRIRYRMRGGRGGWGDLGPPRVTWRTSLVARKCREGGAPRTPPNETVHRGADRGRGALAEKEAGRAALRLCLAARGPGRSLFAPPPILSLTCREVPANRLSPVKDLGSGSGELPASSHISVHRQGQTWSP